MKKILILFILIFNFLSSPVFSKNKINEKIDIFGEVLENIKKEYIDNVDKS